MSCLLYFLFFVNNDDFLRQRYQMQCLVTYNAHVHAIFVCSVCVFSLECMFGTLRMHVQGSRSARVGVWGCVKARRAHGHALGVRGHVL